MHQVYTVAHADSEHALARHQSNQMESKNKRNIWKDLKNTKTQARHNSKGRANGFATVLSEDFQANLQEMFKRRRMYLGSRLLAFVIPESHLNTSEGIRLCAEFAHFEACHRPTLQLQAQLGIHKELVIVATINAAEVAFGRHMQPYRLNDGAWETVLGKPVGTA